MANAPSELRSQQPVPPARVRVLIVDDNAGFRESLVALLDVDEIEVVGQAASGIDALELAPRILPDVVLMDVRMPAMDGVETTRRLKDLIPAAGIVALTGHEDQHVVREMLVSGASGYVLKDSDGEEILNAIFEAARGGAMISPEVTPAVIEELTEALERERRRARELEVAHEALVERAERRHEQIARLGHELRTPVTIILGLAQTLAKHEVPPEQQRELLERLASRAGALAHLVERFQLAADAALTERVDVVEVAHDVAARSDRIAVDVLGEIPPVNLNPVVARRLLEELVDNALRFSPPSAPIDVAVRLGSDEVEVRVADRGAGIDPAVQQRIFDAFEQAEPLNARTHQGAGIGLSLARTAARAADGDVVLERTGPDGSVFLWRVAPLP
jgi:signal transduction histidine kinase